MDIVHISDTHSFHVGLEIPKCNVLIHSGDIGAWRLTLEELTKFLIWFEAQPADVKIFIPGNHDCILDEKWVNKRPDTISRMLAGQKYQDAKILIEAYKVKYLLNSEYVYQGVKFWGSPYSPTFGDDWAFNADRLGDIAKIWAKIPSDVDVLITHTPVFGFLDAVEEKYMRLGETTCNKGCESLLGVIKKRLNKLKLHCGGHIHDTAGVVLGKVSNNRRIWFSNGAVITNDAIQIIKKPLIITI